MQEVERHGRQWGLDIRFGRREELKLLIGPLLYGESGGRETNRGPARSSQRSKKLVEYELHSG